MNKHTAKTAFLDTVPVMTGYLFLGFGFGIIMQQNGYSVLWALAMSLFIYAGSMQYVGVGLLTSGAGLAAAALTTLMVNARHLFYGISMVDAYKGAGKRKPYLIFALTDETYSLVSREPPKGVERTAYCFLVSLFDQCYWVAGSALGALAGKLPLDFTGIDFALTALFVTIFVEQWLSTKNHLPALVGVGSAVACLVVFGADKFLIPTMILIAAILMMLRKTGKEAAHA
ncbi:MAG: AzlC family ABC transporter permease [Faecousia sp.]